MSSNLSERFMTTLENPYISRIRRNHGLEHATLHMLSKRYPNQSLAGHSNLNGFWILGEVSTEDMRAAVDEAMSRLKDGENSLAVHPNCGTNFATAGVLAGGAAAFSMFGAGNRFRDKLERVPLAITLATLAMMVAQPIGLLLQQRPDTLEVVDIVPTKRGKLSAHRVVTRG